MKKSRILLAVLLTAALVSCQETEFGGNEYIPKKGDVVFRMKGNGRTTKSVDSATPAKGVTIDMSTENGPRLYLEETVINLDDMDFGPQTKGTPAYTENLGQLYANNLGVHADKGTFGDFAYESAEAEVGSDGGFAFFLAKRTGRCKAQGAEGEHLARHDGHFRVHGREVYQKAARTATAMDRE